MFFEYETFEFPNLYFYMLFCNLWQFEKVYMICDPFGLTKGNSKKILICLELWPLYLFWNPLDMNCGYLDMYALELA
jgi:hypothetical protein